MANYKRGRCRYHGNYSKPSSASSPGIRKELGLKPVVIPKNWTAGLSNPSEREPAIDWGDRHRGRKYNWGYPRWHDIVFHTRRRRAAMRREEILIAKGADPDDLAWTLDKKPHIYYW